MLFLWKNDFCNFFNYDTSDLILHGKKYTKLHIDKIGELFCQIIYK
jgi:hypothetical protein